MPFNLVRFSKKIKLSALVVLASLIGSSCKSLDPAAQLPVPPIPPSPSSVNVPLEIPVGTLTNLANQAIGPTLFEEKGMDLGSGIVGDFNFQRNGLIQLQALDSQRMQVTFPLRIQGEVGLKPGGLRNLFQSKIPIDRTLAPVMVINPEINPNWSLGISEAELLDLGGKMSISALGMEVDLSQMIRNELRAFARENLTSKSDLVNLKPLIDATWNQVGKPIFLEFEGKKMAFSIRPDVVKIRETLIPNGGLRLNLGLEGQVQSHPASAAPSRPSPLPKLSDNSDASNHLKISIPLRLSYSELDALIKNAFEGQTIRVNKNYLFLPSNFRTKSYGDRLGILMDFLARSVDGEEITGELFLAGKPIFDPNEKVLAFEKVDYHLKSNSSKAKFAAAVKRGKITRQLNQRMRFSLAGTLDGSLEGIQDRVGLQTPFADLSVLDLMVFPSGFYPTATGLEIQLQAEGKVDVSWK